MTTEFKMVPVEPTAEQEEAGCQAYMDADGKGCWVLHKSSMGHAYKAMLAAAPASPQAAQPEHYKPTVPKFKFDTLVEHCKRLERDLAESRAHVNEITLYQENAVWFWQHDGQDFLESLSCPIIIQPHHLRELITHADAGNSQHKLAMDAACGTIQLLEQERDNLRAQLAERDALLREAHDWVDKNNFGGCDSYDLRDRLAALSTTVKPEADHE